MKQADWTDAENAATVASYLRMLSEELAGRSYNKSENNRALQAMTGRSRGAIEFKLQNISAVMIGMGESWIKGYKPAFKFQMSLADAVFQQLSKAPPMAAPQPAPTHFAEASSIFVGAAPTMRNTPQPSELEQMRAIAKKFNVAERDERNRALGYAGEERAYYHERNALKNAGRTDLARKVRWVSKDDGDGAGYDISSYDTDGNTRLIEVKTTNGWDRTPFHISRNELAVASAQKHNWVLFRLFEFSRESKAFELRPPLEAHVSLTATSFQAGFH